MADLRLPRLPDRTPVKLTIMITPDLAAALASYAELYQRTYDREEPVTDLIPAILKNFLESDRAFAKFRASRSRPSS